MTQKSLKQAAAYDAEQEAKRILTIVMARQATSWVSHVTTARVALTAEQLSAGMKGKIVGKEGRNARHFQEKAGVDLLLNDEPQAIVIASFDPFRREVARVALVDLIRDGRIHPGRIEEFLSDARVKVDQAARDAGLAATQGLGLRDFHPAVLRVLGTLQFRTSFGQNQLDHSIESAWLCGSMAAELGFDVMLARRAGLLHDLGKALDQTHDGGHAQSGADFALAYGEAPEIVAALASHHEEVRPQSWLDHLVITADALSAARPGARHGSTAVVQERVQAMEQIASSMPGVSQAYAVQAGRELRILVESEQVSETALEGLAQTVGDRLREELRFPGQLTVTVLRESRVTRKVMQ